MNERRSTAQILGIISVLTITVVVMVAPAFSSGCIDEDSCLASSFDESLQVLSPFQATQADCPSEFEEQVVLLINVERAKVGVAPLSIDIRLQAAARWMSDDSANEDNATSHIASDGSTPRDRIGREGYIPNFTLPVNPENIAGGHTTPDIVVAGWMQAMSGYTDNILNPIFDHLGVGYTYQDMPIFDHYWTVDFGATDDPRDPPLASCDPGFYQIPFPLVKKNN
jgi:uncharacterized protein YkwD